jgi:hypothetical protein
MVESGFGKAVFHDVSDMMDMIEQKGRFKSYFGELNDSDDHFLDKVEEYIRRKVEVINEMTIEDVKYLTVNNSGVAVSIKEFEKSLSLKKGDEGRKTWIGSSKIVPIPYFSLDEVVNRKEIAYESLINGNFSVRFPKGINKLINIIGGTTHAETSRSFFINGSMYFSGETEKERLKSARSMQLDEFKKKGFMISNRRTIKVAKSGEMGEIWRNICVEGGTTRIEKIGKDETKQIYTDTVLSIDDDSDDVSRS